MRLLSTGWLRRNGRGHWPRIPYVLLVALILLSIRLGAASPAWQRANGHRWSRVEPTGVGRPGFTLLTNATLGITFTNAVQEDRTITNRNLGSGSGVALGDVDGDGWCDVFLCGIDVSPRLYRNQGGWRFEDVTR